MMIDTIDRYKVFREGNEQEIQEFKDTGIYPDLYDGVRQIRTLDGKTYSNIFDLTNKELEKFRELGAKLMEFEKDIKKEVEGVYTYAKKRLDNKDDIVRDFDIEIKLFFFLDENDPAFQDYDTDNIMSILQTNKYQTEGESPDWSFGCCDDGEHNTIPCREGTIFEHDKHCANFHALYDHTDLSYREILRIGSFELDVTLHLEYKEKAIYKKERL